MDTCYTSETETLGPSDGGPLKQQPQDEHSFISALVHFENTLEKVYGVVLDLSSAGRLTRAVHEVRSNVLKLKKHYDDRALPLIAPSDNNWDPSEDDEPDVSYDDESEDLNIPSDTQVDQPYRDAPLLSTLSGLADSMASLCDALVDMEATNFSSGRYNSLLVFHDELWTLVQVLKRTDSNLEDMHIQNFIKWAMRPMIGRIQDVDEALQRFASIGSGGIRATQTRIANLHMNCATAAIFLAGVTATTLQFSYIENNNNLAVSVNTLWIGSLALSIGSAMDSYLALSWRQAVFSSPGQRVPFWARFWIMHGYLALLVASSITFLAGLLCFTLHTQRSVSTWVLVACLCICCGGVTCVSIWFIRERWNYFQFSKQQRAQYEWHWSESLRRKRVAWRGFRHKQLLTFTTLSRVIAQMAFKINNVYWRAHDLLEGIWRRFYSIFPDWKSRRRSNLRVDSPFHKAPQDIEARKPEDVEMPTTNRTMTFQQLVCIVVTMQRFVKKARYHVTLSLKDSISTEDGPIAYMRFSPDGRWLVACGRHTSWVFRCEGHGLKLSKKLPRRKHLASNVQCAWSSSSKTFTIIRSPRYSDQSKRVMVEAWALDKSKRSFFETGTSWSYFPCTDDVECEVLMHMINDDTICLSTKETIREIRVDRSHIIGGIPKRSRNRTVPRENDHENCPMVQIASLGRLHVDALLSSAPTRNVSILLLNSGRQIPLTGKATSLSMHALIALDEEVIFQILISFVDQQPELWHVTCGGDGLPKNIKMQRQFKLPGSTPSHRPTNYRWGTATFIGQHNEYVLVPVYDSVHCFVTETGCLLYTYKTDTPRGRPVIAWNVETPMFAHVAGTQIRLCNVSWDKLRHKQRSSGLDIHIPRTASPKVFPAYVGEGNVARVVEFEDVTKSNGGNRQVSNGIGQVKFQQI